MKSNEDVCWSQHLSEADELYARVPYCAFALITLVVTQKQTIFENYGGRTSI